MTIIYIIIIACCLLIAIVIGKALLKVVVSIMDFLIYWFIPIEKCKCRHKEVCLTNDNDGYSMVCQNCGLTVGWYKSAIQAKKAWNDYQRQVR